MLQLRAKRIDLASRIGAAVESYAGEVRDRSFPTTDQTYRPKGA